jgi:hypothetical protein
MARSSGTAKSGGTSRIRFVMLDAELTDGDLTQVTQAIQNALRPPTLVQHRALTAPNQNGGTSSSMPEEASDDASDHPIDAAVDPQSELTEQRRPARDGKPRKYRSPQVIDLDLHSEPSLAGYTRTRELDSDTDKFLTIAAWSKECRKINEIGADHVYTCFRSLHWSTDIGDFGAPLRYLKQQQLMTSSGRGLYSINHLGLDRVMKLNDGHPEIS